VQDRLNIAMEGLHNVQLRLYDISGRLLGEYDSEQLQNGLDVSTLQNGLYYISVIADGVLISKKFIKN
jgi:hypothetical protein